MTKNIIILLIYFIFCFLINNTFALEKIDINSATISQLDELAGIGPTYAQRIIDGRPYVLLDDLLKIKGVGPATLEKIKQQGVACVNCTTEVAQPTQEIFNFQGLNTQNTLAEIVYPTGVIINEVLPNPEEADEENEFIELYNANNFDVDLSEWKIKDTVGTITTFIISKDTKISANGYLTFKRPETKISLNNTGDTLDLLLPNNKIIDSISYTKAPLNQSYNKTTSNWVWNSNITQNSKNIILKPNITKINNSPIDNSKLIDNTLASLNNSVNLPIDTLEDNSAKSNPLPLFLIILGATIISGITVLIFKIKFSKNKK